MSSNKPNLDGKRESKDIRTRIRAIRGALKETQYGMGPLLCISQYSWQKYETKGHIPGGRVLAGLVELGFNANWLLTGNGTMMIEESNASTQSKSIEALIEEANQLEQQLVVLNPTEAVTIEIYFVASHGSTAPCIKITNKKAKLTND
jgi:hypothetical protein